MGVFDLHLHTTASDGLLSPEAVVQAAAQAGLIAIAITDHDTAGGVARAQAEGRRLGLPVIAGVELSAEAECSMHILGLGVDIESPAYQAFMQEQKARRRERNEEMLKRMAGQGFHLPEDCLPQGVPGEYGRKHMAIGMVKAGYSPDIADAFQRFLGRGCPCYVNRRKFSPAELIAAVNGSGGQAVLAHPGRMGLEDSQLAPIVTRLKDEGLAGLEAFYSLHTVEQAEAYRAMADGLGLVCSYGSDWHGYGEPTLAMGFERFDIPERTLQWLNGLIRAGGQ